MIGKFCLLAKYQLLLSSGLEDLQSWILQKTLRNPKELEVDPVQNTSSSLGSISDLFHEVTALNSSQRGVSQMLQQYSDRNLKVGAPVALSDRLEAMSKHRLVHSIFSKACCA